MMMIDAIKDLENLRGPGFFILTHDRVRLLQVFKASDILRWNIGIEKFILDGLVLELTFNDENPNNKENLLRFHSKKSEHERFHLMELEGGEVYFSFFPTPVNYLDLYSQIEWIVDAVYDLSTGAKFEWGIMKF